MHRIITIVLMLITFLNVNAQTKEIEKRVNDIYNHVFTEMVEHWSDSNNRPTSCYFDSLYFSKELLLLDNMIGDLENLLQEPIIHDSDHWICAQDWCKDLSGKVISVEMINEKKATVVVNIHNCENDYKQILTVVYERNNWFIDDMYNNKMRKDILYWLDYYKEEGLIQLSRE